MELFRGWHLPGCWDCCSLRSHVFGLVSGFNKVALYNMAMSYNAGTPIAGWFISCYESGWFGGSTPWIGNLHMLGDCVQELSTFLSFFFAPSSHIRLLLGCANGNLVACWGCQVLGYWSWNQRDICKITGMSIRKCLGCLRCLECLHLQVTDFDAKR